MTSSSLSASVAELVEAEPDRLFAARSYGVVTRAVGLLVEAEGVCAKTGSLCTLITGTGEESATGSAEIDCEVVGFEGDKAFLMPLIRTSGVSPGMLVRLPVERQDDASISLPPSTQLLGRVVDGMCAPIDGGPPLRSTEPAAGISRINPMHRHPIDTPFDVGVGVINALNTIGRGQRVGLLAGSGVGKSVLLGMIARYAHADVVVVGLIGERGREVQEFVLHNLGAGLAKSVVVACPADDSAALRLRGARLATRIAEKYRDEGKHVLLLMDSLTRVSQAQREIGLAMGEPPSSKGYTPSSFAILPQLVERAGNGKSQDDGSITAFYTVLMEEDDLQDPVVDAARAILDGHIVLSREMAEQGIYPAVDVGNSISRVMPRVATDAQLSGAVKFRQLWQTYREQQDLIAIGAYEPGGDPILDEAIALYPALCRFISQGEGEQQLLSDKINQLSELLMQNRMLADTHAVNEPLPAG